MTVIDLASRRHTHNQHRDQSAYCCDRHALLAAIDQLEHAAHNELLIPTTLILDTTADLRDLIHNATTTPATGRAGHVRGRLAEPVDVARVVPIGGGER